MSRDKKFFIITGIFISLFVLSAPAFSERAPEYYISDYSYSTHFSPGETVSVDIEITNNTGTALDDWYVNVILTNQVTGVETVYLNTGIFDLAANSSAWEPTDSTTWTAVAGRYSATIILYNKPGTAQHRVYGEEPIRVGTPVDYVSAFPNMIDLGVLPYGRYMLPNPIRISWDFYTKNRLRRDHPWYMRIYTDNAAKYRGIDDAIYNNRRAFFTSKIWVRTHVENGPAGLVSSDGKYTLPLRIWCLNYGPDVEEMGWSTTILGPPPVNDDYVWKGPLLDDGKRDNDRRAWLWIPDYTDMTSDRRTWRSLIGRDPYNANYVTDSNPGGDFTLDNPFDIYLATEASALTVMGKYTGKLILEIYTP